MAFLFLLLSPLILGSLVLEGTQVPRFIVVSALLFFFIINQLKKNREILLPSKWFLLLFVAFYILNLASVTWSLNVADNFFESQKVLVQISLFFCIYQLIQKEEEALHVAQSLIITCLVLCLVSYYEFWTGDHTLESTRFSLAGHENLLSSLLFLFIPFCLYGYLKGTKKWKTISVLTLILILGLIFLVGTRAVIFALTGGLAFFVFIKFLIRLRFSVRLFVVGGFILTFFVVIGVLVGQKSQLLDHAVSRTEASSLSERVLLWKKTGQLIYENPVFGVGSGNWQYNYSKFSVADIDKALFYNIFFKRPHNDFLWVFSENGLIGFMLILIMIGLLGWQALRHIFKTHNQLSLIFLASLVGLFIIACFSFPKERIAHICLATILVVYLIKDIPHFSGKPNSYIRTSLFLALVGLGFNLWIGWQRFNGEYFTKKALLNQQKNQPEEVIKNGYHALSYFYSSDPSCTPILSYIGWGYNATNQVHLLVPTLQAAYELSPYDYKVLSNYGYALIRSHEWIKARDILHEAYRINPNYEPVMLNLCVLAYNQEDYNKALFWLEKIPDYAQKYTSNLERIQEKLHSGSSGFQ